MPQLPSMSPASSTTITVAEAETESLALTTELAWPVGATKCYAVFFNATLDNVYLIVAGDEAPSARVIAPNLESPAYYGPVTEATANGLALFFDVAGEVLFSWDEVDESTYE